MVFESSEQSLPRTRFSNKKLTPRNLDQLTYFEVNVNGTKNPTWGLVVLCVCVCRFSFWKKPYDGCQKPKQFWNRHSDQKPVVLWEHEGGQLYCKWSNPINSLHSAAVPSFKGISRNPVNLTTKTVALEIPLSHCFVLHPWDVLFSEYYDMVGIHWSGKMTQKKLFCKGP